MKKILLVMGILLFFGIAEAAISTGNYTLKLAGGNYSTMESFWNDLANLTGNINLLVDASTFSSAANAAAITETLGGYTIHVYPVTYPTTTDGTTGAIFSCDFSASASWINMQMEGAGAVTIEGIVWKAGTDMEGLTTIVTVTTPFTYIIRRCVVKGDDTNAASAAVTYSNANVNANIYNNVIYNMSATTVAGITCTVNLSASSYFSNNTVYSNVGTVGAGLGGNSVSRTGLADNNLCHLNVTDFYDVTAMTGHNNSSYDATATGFTGAGSANNRINKTTDPFTNSAGLDFTLKAGSDPIGNGLDLSAKFTDDFFGVTRTTWDIGACAYVSGVAPVLPQSPRPNAFITNAVITNAVID